MTEDKTGLEKHALAFARRLGKKIENGGGKRKEQGFTAEQALEKFRLLSAAGPEGQEPIVSYGHGSTIVLSDQEKFPPGTILREKETRKKEQPFSKELLQLEKEGIEFINTEPEETIHYVWWCVGNKDDKTGFLTIFESVPFPAEGRTFYLWESPVYLFNNGGKDGNVLFLKRRLKLDSKKEYSFDIGSPGTIQIDSFEAGGWSKESLAQFRNERETLQVDVIAFRKKVKKEVREKERTGLKQLVPQRIPGAI